MTTRSEISNWLNNYVESDEDYTHVIIAVDTWDWEDFPVPVKRTENIEEAISNITEGNSGCNLMEVYNLSMPLEDQLNEHRAYHI